MLLRVVCGVLLVFDIVGAQTFSTTSQVVFTLQETVDTTTTITDVDCEDSGGGDNVIIRLGNVGPVGVTCSNCFQVFTGCGGQTTGPRYCLQFLALGPLNHTTSPVYALTLECVDIADPTGTPATQAIELRLNPNTAPTLPTISAHVHADTQTTAAGTDVLTAACSDSDNDPLVYTLTTDPPSAAKFFSITNDGSIQVAQSLVSLCASSVVFGVSCKDPTHAAVGPRLITVTLQSANSAPVVSGINRAMSVAENAEVDTTLATISVSDGDSDPVTCVLAATPQSAEQLFTLSPTDSSPAEITVVSELNFETAANRNPNVTVTCSDGHCLTTAFLLVSVTDVNEALTVSPSDFTLTVDEGLISVNPQWKVVDEDLNDNPTYTVVGGTGQGLFTIDSFTGIISSFTSYDVDAVTALHLRSLIVTLKDSGNNVVTATVTLSIQDVNDNPPTFAPGTTTIATTNCTAALGVIGSITASDADSSFRGNNLITYSGTLGPVSVTSSGNIVTSAGLTAGQSYLLEVTALDAGQTPGPLASSPRASVNVVVAACSSTTPAPTPTPPPATTAAPPTPTTTLANSANVGKSFEDNSFWISLAVMLGVVFLIAMFLMVWKVCLPNASRIRSVFRRGGRYNKPPSSRTTPRKVLPLTQEYVPERYGYEPYPPWKTPRALPY